MEQKLRQKRQTPGMVQASDARPASTNLAKARKQQWSQSSAQQSKTRELHGINN